MTIPEETKTQRQCREFWTGLQSHVKYAWGRGADGQFLAEDARLKHRAWEEAQRIAREDGARLRETLRDVTGVAICGLFDTHREDTLREFSLQELARVTEVTAPLMEEGVTVESVYRRGYAAAIDQERGEGLTMKREEVEVLLAEAGITPLPRPPAAQTRA